MSAKFAVLPILKVVVMIAVLASSTVKAQTSDASDVHSDTSQDEWQFSASAGFFSIARNEQYGPERGGLGRIIDTIARIELDRKVMHNSLGTRFKYFRLAYDRGDDERLTQTSTGISYGVGARSNPTRLLGIGGHIGLGAGFAKTRYELDSTRDSDTNPMIELDVGVEVTLSRISLALKGFHRTALGTEINNVSGSLRSHAAYLSIGFQFY